MLQFAVMSTSQFSIRAGIHIYLAAACLALNLSSCHRSILCGSCQLPPEQRPSYLIEYTWGLISAASINSRSSGVLHGYQGLPVDSLHFLWNTNPDVDIYAVCSFIQNNGDSTISDIVSLTAAANVPHSDTATISYDTLITATPWRPGYSDTLLISKVSPTLLVFQVGYSDSLGAGVEVDSFRRVDLYRPF
jgi:hypothetical protein